MDPVETFLADFVAQACGCDRDKIKGSSDLVKDLGLDSLDLTEVAMELEEVFDMEIPNDDDPNLRGEPTISNFATFIKNGIGNVVALERIQKHSGAI